MSKKFKGGQDIGESKYSLYYIDLIDANPAEKRKEGFLNSWPYYVSIGRIWNNTDIYKNPVHVYSQKVLGEYQQQTREVKLYGKNRDENLRTLFSKLFKSGLLLYLHTDNFEIQDDDNYLYHTLKSTLRVENSKTFEPVLNKYFEETYLCTLDEAKEIIDFGNTDSTKNILETLKNTYEAFDGHLEELLNACMEIVESSSTDPKRRDGFINNLARQFLTKKSKIGKLMYDVVVNILSLFLKDASKLVFQDSKCIDAIERTIQNCYDRVKDKLFPANEQAKKSSVEKIESVMLPKNNSDLSWFHFTQIALEEVYTTLYQNDIVRRKKLTKKYTHVLDVIAAKRKVEEKENNDPDNRRFLEISLKLQELSLKKDAKRNHVINKDLLLELNKTRRKMGIEEISIPLRDKLLTDRQSWKRIENVDFKSSKAPLLLESGDIVNKKHKSTMLLVKDQSDSSKGTRKNLDSILNRIVLDDVE